MTTRKTILLLAASTVTLSLLAGYRSASAQPPQKLITHIAELEIDPAQLDAYRAALTEEIDASLRLEPGVLTLYAVALKDDPTQIRLFETYASGDAYQSHLLSPNFLKYKAATQGMVKSLKLIETSPIRLGAKMGAKNK